MDNYRPFLLQPMLLEKDRLKKEKKAILIICLSIYFLLILALAYSATV